MPSAFDPVRLAGGAAAAGFGAVSRLRHAKSLHPKGVLHDATVVIDGAHDAPPAGLLREPGRHRAVVRLSRSIGLPSPLPDFFGISLRLPELHGPGRHQDFLLVTSIDAPVLHHAFVPVRSVEARVYSSSLPYRAGDERFLIGALPRGPLRFELAVAPVLGRFRRVGELRLGRRLDGTGDHTPFNVWNTGGGLEPAGFLQRLRREAYRGSQAGWREAIT